MALKRVSTQRHLAGGLAKDDLKLAAEADEIPELRRGRVIHSGRYLASNLPPLHRLTDIFADMASKAQELGFQHVLFRLGGRPLRVATMCSGTEAPLLALELIQTGKCSDISSCSSFACFVLLWSDRLGVCPRFMYRLTLLVRYHLSHATWMVFALTLPGPLSTLGFRPHSVDIKLVSLLYRSYLLI
jgi:hypothetical protein